MDNNNSYKTVFWRLLVAFIIISFLVGCAGPVERADSYVAQDEWIKAVSEYRRAVARYPRDVEYRSRLKQTEQKAADFYYQRGMMQFERDNIDASIIQYQQGLVAMPDNVKLNQALSSALSLKEANALYAQAQLSNEAGKREDAIRLLKKALATYPAHKQSTEALNGVYKSIDTGKGADSISISSKSPVTLNFRQTDLRTSFEFVAKSFGVDIIFDESIRSAPVTLFAKDVTFAQALNLMLATTKTFYKKIAPNTILIAPDTKEKRSQYEDHYIRTIQLSSIGAKEMSEIIKGLVNVKKIIVNEPLNILVIRDSEDVLKVVDKIIEANDRRGAELILEVEILEVNRVKAERLGLDFGSYNIKAGVPGSTTIPASGSIPTNVQQAALLTLPSLTFNFYKQDVDAKILANPKIRVLSGKSAKIHIGDRVPLRTATMQDTLGSLGTVRTTYDYKDVGIRLSAEPVVHIDNSVTVKVALEVSALGENLGSQNEPAYRIGTRNAETFMMLRDGETAILGGLIRDEDRSARVGIAGIGDIPAIGALLSSHDNSIGRTDVLLTITPRVVRGKDMPPKDVQYFVSGTEERYMTDSVFGDLNAPEPDSLSPLSAKLPVQEIRKNNDNVGVTPANENPPPVGSDATPSGSSASTVTSVLSFSQPAYEGIQAQEIKIDLMADNLPGMVKLPVEILYNSQLLEYVQADAGGIAGATTFSANNDAERGIVKIELQYSPNAPAASGSVATLTMKARKPGTSYLVYRIQGAEDLNGNAITPQLRSSRVIIK